MNIQDRLRHCAKHTGLDAVVELLNEAAAHIEGLNSIPKVQGGEPVPFLLNGTRFKMSFQTDLDADLDPITTLTCFNNFENQLDGRWVALVAAEDDAHLKLRTAQPAQATQAEVTRDEVMQAAKEATAPEWQDVVDGWHMGLDLMAFARAILALRPVQAEAQQPDNTACKSVQKRLEAQQPATTEPMKSFAELREKHRAGIDAERAKLVATAAPKDHQIAALVNKVRDIARMFHDHQSLRERIAIELVPALKASQDVQSNAERWIYAIADGGNQSMNFIDIFDDWDGDGSFVEAFDKARLADKKEGSAA